MATLGSIVERLGARWPDVDIEIRADAGFTIPAVYEYCEQEGIARMMLDTLRPRLIEIGGRVKELVTNIELHLASSYPGRHLWQTLMIIQDPL